MLRIYKLSICVFVILLILFASGCSVIPKAIQGIFASKTPTSTNTPTVTPTPTKTPSPAIVLWPCVYEEDCSSALMADDVRGKDPTTYGVNEVIIAYDQPVKVIVGWIAKDQAHLDANLKQLEWIFTVDGYDYFQEAWLESGEVDDANDPSKANPGVWLGVAMKGWKVGESHTVRVGMKLLHSTNDGWSDVESGYSYILTYEFTPVELPTATPTETPTATPTITLTPRPLPTRAPVTNTPACSAEARIEITNSTGAGVTLQLSGPAFYKLNLGTGLTTLNVCPGSYSYKAWGCGGATDSGTINSGEAHEFYCT